MPALPAVPNVLEIKLKWLVGTDANALTRLFFLYAGAAPTVAQVNSYCTSFNALTSGNWPVMLDTDSSYEGLTVRDLSSDLGAEGEGLTTVAGTRDGAPLGAGTAVLLNYQIARHYRGGRPKSFVPWGTAADLATRNTWASGLISDVRTNWTEVLEAIVDAGPIGAAVVGSQCQVSYYGPPNRLVTGSTGRVKTVSTQRAAALIDPVESYAISSKVASQRRRNLQRF